MRSPTAIHTKKIRANQRTAQELGLRHPTAAPGFASEPKAQQALQPDHVRAHIGNRHQPAPKNLSRVVGWLWTVLGTSAAGLARFSILRNRVRLPTGLHRLTHLSSFPPFPSKTLPYSVGPASLNYFAAVIAPSRTSPRS